MKKIFLRLILPSLILSLLLSSCDGKNLDTQDTQPPPPSKYENCPTVIIDAGHGGEDGGAVGVDGSLEKHLNLTIATKLEEMLLASGVKTRLTRDEDILLYDRNSDYQGHKKSQDMATRIAISKEYENAIFISIHMNSFPQEKYRGLQVYYSENSPLSQELAATVQTLTVKNLQPENTRQIKPSGVNIYLLRKITHPAILIECGFLSNSEECALLGTEEYQNRLCLVIYTAILEYFDATRNNSTDTT